MDDKGTEVYSLDFAVHSYAERSDASGSNGNVQDVKMEVEVSLDLAYLSAPLGGFRATGSFAGKTDSVIFQFGQLAV